MSYIAVFFAGVFLCNALPHLTAGLQGQPFPTPFAKPRGVGNSSPVINLLWGLFNLLVGLLLIEQRGTDADHIQVLLVAGAGALLIGVSLALHFGKVMRDRH